MARYGVNSTTGMLVKCKAKPENVGKGRCNHGEHIELVDSKETQKIIRGMNEKRLADFNSHQDQTLKKENLTIPYDFLEGEGLIQTSPNNRPLNKQEFSEATVKIADAFPEEDWKVINNFYNKFHNRLSNGNISKNFENSVENIKAYLDSNDPTAIKVREFLGPEVDTQTFSEILVYEVKSMRTRSHIRRGKNEPARRLVLTNLNNDMTKERYVASVLFFGGRCCYCNKVLDRKEGSATKATGEHITPLSSSNSNIVGGTRYGNMALACFSCNNERGDKSLNEWMEKTKRVSPQNKEASLKRIEAFRNFALYKEYTPEESEKINQGIDKFKEFLTSKDSHKVNGVYDAETFEEIQNEFKVRLHDLEEEIRQ